MTEPLAAVALLTDGLGACLTAARRPHFGWDLVCTAGSDPASCYQGAYELRVSEADGTLLWDSGVVASGEQHFVPYGGPGTAGQPWTLASKCRNSRP